MTTFSTSFTLGKASVAHGANLEHNNREFIARNIDASKTSENITYARRDVQETYQTLFGAALKEYNEKQTRKDRLISDYFQHISNSKREEAFYEIVVQFGDSKSAPCGSQNGELCKTMLDDYVRSFQTRNPNLHVFNAVLHMDEASPHLHINFIPVYTQGRQKGLSKGVSMKAALVEQGFMPTSVKNNQLVAWEASEMETMEHILQQHGFSREDKNAKYAHKTVEEYKNAQDAAKIVTALRDMLHVSNDETAEDSVRQLKAKLRTLERENETLSQQRNSPYKSFFYAVPEKQAYVQAQLDAREIPYRETENGFEAQEFFATEIRKIEKDFKPVRSTIRETIRSDIDRLPMQSKDMDELLEKLKQERYVVKTGKYLAVKPPHGEQFIRLKSLGALYSEYALRNRLNAKKSFETAIQKKMDATQRKDSMEFIVLRTIQFYTVAFSNGALPMHKRDSQKPFAWTNDSELDKLTALNQRINAGATTASLRAEFETLTQTVSEKEKVLLKSQSDLKAFHDLKEKIAIVFEGKQSDHFTPEQAERTLKLYPSITQSNYRNVDVLIRNEQETVSQAEAALALEQEKLQAASDLLATAEKVTGGTYVQTLVGEERQRREAKFIPNGLKNAGI